MGALNSQTCGCQAATTAGRRTSASSTTKGCPQANVVMTATDGPIISSTRTGAPTLHPRHCPCHVRNRTLQGPPTRRSAKAMWVSSGCSRLIAPSSALPSASASNAAVPSLPPATPASPPAPASGAPPVTPGPPALLPPSCVPRPCEAPTVPACDPTLPASPWDPVARRSSGPAARPSRSSRDACSSANRSSFTAACVAVRTSLALPPLLLGPLPGRDSCARDPDTSDRTAGTEASGLPVFALDPDDVVMPRGADDGCRGAATLLAGAAPAGEPKAAADPRPPGALPSKSNISSSSSQLPSPMLGLS